MKRVFTATCLAATFAVGLAAQSTTSTPTQTPPAGQRGGPRTVTGCLRAGDTAGTFMLTDVQMQGGRAGGDTTTGTTGGTTAGTTGGTTAGGTTAGGTGTEPQSGRAMTPMSVMLVPGSDVDLKAHVGHKIEVTGTMAGGRGGAGGTTAGATTAGGTTTGGTTAGGTTAGGTTTGTGGTTGTGTSASGGQGGGRGPRSMNVTSVRMISESCS